MTTLVVDGNKFCPGCDDERPLVEFGKRKHSKDGYAPRCRSCTNDQRREYRANNLERAREVDNAWYAKSNSRLPGVFPCLMDQR